MPDSPIRVSGKQIRLLTLENHLHRNSTLAETRKQLTTSHNFASILLLCRDFISPSIYMTTIRTDADLLQAAREMIVAIHHAGSAQQRHKLLQQMTSLLSDENFPALIKLFVIVGGSDDTFAKNSLADALADTLVRGDIPSAPLTAWGSVSLEIGGQSRGFSAGARLDPLQYLCAWKSQPSQQSSLSSGSFSRAIEAMIAVFAERPEAAERYRAKIRADLLSSQDGAINTATRSLLNQVVDDWQAGMAPKDIATRALGTKRTTSNIADMARAQMLALNMQPPKKDRP